MSNTDLPRILLQQSFKAGQGQQADDWIKSNVASYARAYKAEGSEHIYWDAESQKGFSTDGGDQVRGDWNWVDIDDNASDIIAIIRSRF